MEEVLKHLAHGWRGFVRILVKETAHGVRLQITEIELLERLQAELAQVIEQQRARLQQREV